MHDQLTRLISAVRAADPDLDGRMISDLLWLAATADPGWIRPRPVDADGTVPATPATSATPPTPAPPTAEESTSDNEGAPATANDATELFDGSGGNLTGTSAGRQVFIPAPTGLPDTLGLARALRPFKRAWPHGAGLRLDVDETVRAFAATGEILPMLSPTPERWFDVDIVVDASPTMSLWAGAADEFAAVVRQVGVFRTVSVRTLRPPANGSSTPVLHNAFDRRVSPSVLRSPDARRLLVIVSDCQAEYWYQADVWELIRLWAASTPTVIVNPLRSKHWRLTGLNQTAARVFPGPIGARNTALDFDPPLTFDDSPQWTPVPVVSMGSRSVGSWARLLMRRDPRGVDAVLVASPFIPDRDDDDPAEAPSPARRLEAFEWNATGLAFRLAVLCSPFPQVSLAVIHLLRDALVPEAGLDDIAELTVCGLFDGLTVRGIPVLRFKDGVRELLVSRLARDEAWRAYETLSRHIDRQLARLGRMSAVVRDADGSTSLPADLMPFAEASQQALALLGVRPPQSPVRSPAGPVETEPVIVVDDPTDEEVDDTTDEDQESGFVFVAYARNDRAYVERLIAHLRRHAIPLWTDAELDYGDRWFSTIARRIETCSAMVVIQSEAASRSEWVHREVVLAVRRHKPVVPLVLGGDAFAELDGRHHEPVHGGRMPSSTAVSRLRELCRVREGHDAGPTAGYAYISCSRDSQNYVKRLRAMLRDWQIPSRINRDLGRADELPPSIEDDIDGCSAFIVILTPASASSKVVQAEIARAQARGRPVLPLLLEDRVVSTLRNLRSEDVRGNLMPSERFLTRLRRLCQRPGPEPQPESAPPAPVTNPVLITYARRDRDYVRRLANHLQRAGVPVWFDEQLPSGDRFKTTFRTRIASAPAVIVVMSSAAQESKWVGQEIFHARRYNVPLFPVLLEGEPPVDLRSLQYADVRGGRLPPVDFVRAIRDVSRSRPLPGRLDPGVGEIRTVRFSPDGVHLAAVGARGVVLFNAEHGFERVAAVDAAEHPTDAAFTPDGATLVVADGTGRIHLSLVRGRLQRTIQVLDGAIRSVRGSPDGRLLAVVGADGSAQVLTITGDPYWRAPGAVGWVRALEFGSDGNVVTGGEDGSVRTWDTATGVELDSYFGHSAPVGSLAVTPTRKSVPYRIGSGSDDHTVRLWRNRTKGSATVLTGHTAGVTSIGYSPDGAMLVSAAEDRAVRIWKVSTGRLQYSRTLRSLARSVAFTPDGQYIVLGCADGSIQFWDVRRLR